MPIPATVCQADDADTCFHQAAGGEKVFIHEWPSIPVAGRLG